MFVLRRRLEEHLEAGRSLEEIGRLEGRHPSTVAYWLRKHGLEARGRERHAPKGGLVREKLERLVAEGLSVREIAEAVGRSTSTVRHWLRRYELVTDRAAVRAAPPDERPGRLMRNCATHGWTEFGRTGSAGHYRCLACRAERVADRRRAVKAELVAEAGGACALCGYDRSLAALQFHHVDPATKEFAIAHRGLSRGIARARAEAAKCVLLCANCHAEVEAGYAKCPERR